MKDRNVFQEVLQKVLFQEHLQGEELEMDACIPLLGMEACTVHDKRPWLPHCGANSRRSIEKPARVYLSRQHDHEDAATVAFNVGRGHTEESHKVAVVLRLQGAIGAWLTQPWRFDQIFEAYM